MCTYNGLKLSKGLKVVVILGATATGKTRLALDLADQFGVEIVNADSRYLYRGLDVGTAKPTSQEMERVTHHLIDIADPTEVYSLARYLSDLYVVVEEIGRRGKLPMIVGGTPLYHRAFIEGWRVPQVPPDERVRARLDFEECDELYARLARLDPASARRIDPANKRRVIRALEIFELTGRRMSELQGKEPPPYSILLIGLHQDRDRLYTRIDERARWMYQNGILDEAKALLNVDPSLPAMSAIGYPEALAVVRGKLNCDEAIERTCYANHRYVRHQETWFRRFKNVRWVDSSNPAHIDEACRQIRAFFLDSALIADSRSV